MAFLPNCIVGPRRPGRSLNQAWLALMVAAICTVGGFAHTSIVRAHGTTEETAYHSLTLVIGFPDGGLVDAERLCLDLFAAEDTALSTPIQARCLATGEKSVIFDGLPHGSFQIAVPGDGSSVAGERYAGKVAESDIPNDPEVDAYVIDLSLSLVDAAAGTTGSLDFAAFLCPASVSAAGSLDQWIAACPDRIGGLNFTVSSEGSLAATTAAAATGADGQAVVSGLPAGLYQANEGPLSGQVQQTTWFVTSSFDGVATRLDAGVPFSLRPAESLSVVVFHVMAVGEGAPASPIAGNPTDLLPPEQSAANGPQATATAGSADITPFISVGQPVRSGPVATPEPGPPLHPDIVSTITRLPATGGIPPAGPEVVLARPVFLRLGLWA